LKNKKCPRKESLFLSSLLWLYLDWLLFISRFLFRMPKQHYFVKVTSHVREAGISVQAVVLFLAADALAEFV
jgi:hypothetical protein